MYQQIAYKKQGPPFQAALVFEIILINLTEVRSYLFTENCLFKVPFAVCTDKIYKPFWKSVTFN